MSRRAKVSKVSACCGAPVVKAPPPFTSILCPACINMTVAVTPARFQQFQQLKGGSTQQ